MVIFSARKAGAGIKLGQLFKLLALAASLFFQLALSPPEEASHQGRLYRPGAPTDTSVPGKRYWRTSKIRFFASTGMMTAEPMCCTIAA